MLSIRFGKSLLAASRESATLHQIGSRSGSGLGVRGSLVAAVFIMSVGIAWMPIFRYQFLSINDYFNHLARSYILLHYHDQHEFARFFALNWKPLPNLALDLWMLAIGQVLPVEFAGRLFVAAILVFLLSGVIFLHRVTFNKWSLWPFLAVVLLYNRLLTLGLLNFLFGVTLCLHVFSLWIRLRTASPVTRASVLSVAAIMVFFAHLFAFGILAVTIAAYHMAIFAAEKELWRKRIGDLIVGAIPFLPALAILIWFSPHSSSSYILKYRDFWTRIAGFGAPILYDRPADVICYLILFTLCGWVAATRAIVFDRRLTAGVLALFVLQFCMPNVIMTAEAGDRRIPIPMMFLAIAATDPKTASPSQRIALTLATAAIFVFRVSTVDGRWSLDQPIYADAWAGLSSIPAGARVATAFPSGSFDDASAPAIALSYIPTWEVVSRGGFNQTLFAYPTQQPLVLRPRYAALASVTSANEIWRAFTIADDSAASPSPALVAALREYDYVAFLDRRGFTMRPTSLFQPFYDGRYIRIYSLGTAPLLLGAMTSPRAREPPIKCSRERARSLRRPVILTGARSSARATGANAAGVGLAIAPGKVDGRRGGICWARCNGT